MIQIARDGRHLAHSTGASKASAMNPSATPDQLLVPVTRLGLQMKTPDHHATIVRVAKAPAHATVAPGVMKTPQPDHPAARAHRAQGVSAMNGMIRSGTSIAGMTMSPTRAEVASGPLHVTAGTMSQSGQRAAVATRHRLAPLAATPVDQAPVAGMTTPGRATNGSARPGTKTAGMRRATAHAPPVERRVAP